MTVIDHIKAARLIALDHEQATADLRIAAFRDYQAANRSDGDGHHTTFEARRAAHVAAYEALWALDTVLEQLNANETSEADLQRLINALNS